MHLFFLPFDEAGDIQISGSVYRNDPNDKSAIKEGLAFKTEKLAYIAISVAVKAFQDAMKNAEHGF